MISEPEGRPARIAVVLPAYNEAAALSELIQAIHAALRTEGRPHEIIVVDDGSTDGSDGIAAREADRAPVRVIRHETNRGYGAALRTGLEAGRDAAIVVTMDADGTHDPALIAPLATAVENGCDVAIASRFRAGGDEVGVPWNRRLLSHGARRVFGMLFGEKNVRDYTSGYRAYEGSVVCAILEQGEPNPFPRQAGFTAGLELMLRARDLGARFAEVPLVLRYDRKVSDSKLKVWRTLRQYAALTATRSRSRKSR